MKHLKDLHPVMGDSEDQKSAHKSVCVNNFNFIAYFNRNLKAYICRVVTVTKQTSSPSLLYPVFAKYCLTYRPILNIS